MIFKYKDLWEDVFKRFKFGDTYVGKAKEIGIKTTTLIKLRNGDKISLDDIMKVVTWLGGSSVDAYIDIPFDIDI